VKERVISVTTAARMFADCVNRVRYQGVSFLLQKNGVSVARIVPVDPVSGMNLEDVASPSGEAPPVSSESEKQASSPPTKASSEVDAPKTPSLPPRPMLNW
jgi:antitoxin (DNA-binding transcriptional repressor) of toxin-antitoxin stability system